MKKIISLILAVLLCLGAFPLTVFADTEPEIEWELPSLDKGVRLVSIGDSTSNGYFLEGYVDKYQGIGSNAGENCYPMKLYGELAEIYGEDNVIFSQYCLNSMRWNELRILLERAFAGEEFVGDDLCYLDNFNRLNNPNSNDYVNSFNSAKNNGIAHIGDPKVLDQGLYATFADSIRNADIITIDLGMNNFGTYVCQRLMANIGMKPAINEKGEYTENLLDIRDQLIAAYGDEVIGKIRAIEASMLTQIGDYDSWAKLALQNSGATVLGLLNTVDSIPDAATAKVTLDQMATALDDNNHNAWMLFDVIETVTYSFGCVLLHYDKSMEYIYKANPDAMVIIDGLYNSMNGMVAKMDETTSFPFGEVWGTLLSNVSGFLSGKDETYAKNRWIDKIRYGNVNPKLSIILDEIKNFDTTFAGKNPLIDYKNNVALKNSVDRIIDMVYKLNDNMPKAPDLTPVISAALLQGIHDVTYSNVESGVEAALKDKNNAELIDLAIFILELGGKEVNKEAVPAGVANYVANKVVEGVIKNCCHADGENVAASDVKSAYQENKISEFGFDISSLTSDPVALAAILLKDYSPLDDLCLDPVNSNFAVSAGFEVIRKNIVKAAALTTINLGDVFQAFGPDTDLAAVVAPALADYDNASDTAKALLHICVRFVGLRGVGTHPDAIGAEAKYQAVKAQMPTLPEVPGKVLTIRYVDDKGVKIADDYKERLENGMPYNVSSPTAEGYRPDKAVVSGTMGNEDLEITVVYTAVNYNLRIHYQYADGTEAASDYFAEVASRGRYSVPSPTITGYTPSLATVSGTMQNSGTVETTVTYTPNKYKLTIHYVDTDGKKVANDYTDANVLYNSAYKVDSPVLTGYDADSLSVSGTMGTENKELTVTYTPREYDLTIHYQYAGGSEAASDHTEKVKYNGSYNVVSPEVNEEGFYPDQYTVSGTMDTEGKEITVTYSQGYPGICDALKEVSLSAGTHHLYVNGKDMGEFTFTKSGSSWRIKDASGKYLAVSGGKLTNSTSAANWTYSNNRLSYSTGGWFFGLFSTTYYLTADANGLAVTTSNRNNTVAFYDGTPGANGRHQPAPAVQENVVAATCKAVGGYDEVIYCTVCGEKLHTNHVETPISKTHTPGQPVHENEVAASCTKPGSYDEVTYCTVCGKVVERQNNCEIAAKGHTPGKAKRETIEEADYMVTRCTVCGEIIEKTEVPAEVITANVTVTSRTSGFWIFRTTTYTANILAMSNDPTVTVSKVEYSTNNRSWRTGTSYQSLIGISTLYVRVTDSTGAVTNFVYKNGTVTKL